MANTYSDETKLKALGLIAAGRDLKEISMELTVTYPTLLKWRKDLKEGRESGNLAELVNCDELLVRETAARIADDLSHLSPSESEAIAGELMGVVEGIEGYKVLSARFQSTALVLAKKIMEAAEDRSLGVSSLESLVNSLSRLQEAFFNKNTTNINVLNQNNISSDKKVSKFKSLQKS